MNDHTGTLRTMIHQRKDGPCICAECRALKYAINELSEREAREILAQIYDEQGSDVQAMHVREGRLDSTDRFAERCIIAALTREQREVCVCGEPGTPNTVHRADGPCYQQEAPGAVWPFIESPGEFADRLAQAMREFPLLGAVRHVLIENPPTLATPPAPVGVRGLLEQAFDAGFDISGEGWNGEYGANTDGVAYLSRRKESCDAILSGQQAGVVIDDAMVVRALNAMVPESDPLCQL